MKKVILIGGGGHALSLLEMFNDKTINFVGYCDCKPNTEMPIPYLGTDEEILENYSSEKYEIHHAVVYADTVNLDLRKKLVEKFKYFKTISLFSTSAIISPNSVIGEGTSVFHKCVINRSKIGKNCVINTGSIIEHDCFLGDNVFVASGCVICGGVKIGNNVFIGAGTVIRDSITIADDIIIGMGSIVTKSITKSGTYIGVPASLLEK